MKIQEKKSKKRRSPVTVTNIMDRLLIREQNFRIDIGKKKKKKTKIR
jgi:hypothetical protein